MWRPIIALALATLASDLIKIVTSRGKWRPLHLGGMPSTHAAIVSSLIVVVFLEQGLSVLFAVVLGFGALVIRDAFGVRWEVTRHSEALNRLTKGELYKVTGHTWVQVIVGVIVGLVVAVCVYLVPWGSG